MNLIEYILTLVGLVVLAYLFFRAGQRFSKPYRTVFVLAWMKREYERLQA